MSKLKGLIGSLLLVGLIATGSEAQTIVSKYGLKIAPADSLWGAGKTRLDSLYIGNWTTRITATAANLNTLIDDSMADALHRHSELSASDGTPNPALSVDASGNVGIGTTAPNVQGAAANATVVTQKARVAGNTNAYEFDANYEATGVSIGNIDFVNTLNTSGKIQAQIFVQTTGTTAANRGAILYFNTKPDGGAIPAAQWSILSNGDFVPYTDNGPNIGSEAAHPDTVFFRSINTTGNVFVGTATANTKATGPSLTINQGGSDDEILSLKSTDVNHPFTAIAEANTYGVLRKVGATTGGLQVDGYTSTMNAMYLVGNAVTFDSTQTTSGAGTIQLLMGKTSGTGQQLCGGIKNLFAITDYNATKFIVNAAGNFYYDGTGAAYDTYDDAELLRAYGKALAPRDTAFAAPGLLRYTEDDVVRSGVLSARRSEGGMTNGPALARLAAGAAHQAAKGLENYGRIHSDIHDKANVAQVDTAAVVAAFRQIGPPRRYTYKPEVFIDVDQIERAKQDTAKSVLDRIVAERVGKLVQARTVQVIDRLDTAWSETAVPTDSIVESYKVALDSLGAARDAEPIYAYTRWDTLRTVAKVDTIQKVVPGVVSTGEKADIADSVRVAQLAKVNGALANYQKWIDAQAAEEHVSLVAQEVAPAIAALTGAPADTTQYDLRDLVHTQQVVIQSQGREIAALKARLDGIEARLAKVEGR